MEYLQVLVVDDEPGMRLGVQRSLNDAVISLPDVQTEVGFRVNMAESGEQALEMIAAGRPDILLLDHKMGGMSGLEVLDHIKAGQQDHMLTIMITAYASLETAVTAIKQGAYDFLAKPFTPAELKATIRKAAESLVVGRQARKLAQEKRQVRFEFISVLAHELKSPLAAVEGYLNIMQQRAAGERLSDYDNVIERCIIRMGGMRKLIFDLLDLTRIESGQKSREFTCVHLPGLAWRAFEAVQLEAQKRGISLNLRAADDLSLYGDVGELEIIFNNLVSNAVKYNRDGGKIDV
ncbi:MAG: response regulator, partial [Sedimentisphaerales bacterium]|nr:response regulator [Sedimentisphaerales bacterium]